MTPLRYRRNEAKLRVELLERRELLAVGDFVREIVDPSTVSQSGADFGYAIAASGNLVAIGAPGDDGAGTFSRGKVHIYERTTGALVQSISNPSPATGDRFGEAVALDGHTLVVGAKYDDAGAVDSGMVYVFDATTGELLKSIPNPTPASFDYFGHSVAIRGDKVFVGAYLDDAFGMDAGVVHAFQVESGALLYSVGNPNPAPFEFFGFDVSASNNRLAVGAHRVDAGAVDSGAVFIFDATNGMYLRQIHNPMPDDFDYFGYSIAVSDSVVAVGAYRDDTGAANAGSAYTFDVNSGALIHSVHNPAPAMADDFGYSVALSESSLIVGAYRDNAGANDAGSAYQFDLASGALIRSIPNPTPFPSDYFGAAVAAAGDTFVVGAYWDDTGALDAGAAYWYDALTGDLLYSLINPSISSFNYFGHAVAISGNWLAVGAHLDDALGTDSGTVYLYDASTGGLIHTIHNPTPTSYDNFGYAISLSGNLLAVGAHRDDVGAMDSGVVHVFDVSSGALLRTLLNPNPNVLDYFGFSVSISGDTVAVGASRDDVGATDAGAVYVFDVSSGALIASIANPFPAVSDQFGYSVALQGSRLVVGAPQADGAATNSGTAYLFDVATGALLQTLANPFPVAGDFFGHSVDIHYQRVVVGAPQQGSGAGTGIVYLFDTTSAALVHTLPDPQPAAFNQFGSSVSLSEQWVVVGAPGADTWGTNAGRASLFELHSGEYVRELHSVTWTAGDLVGTSVAAGNEYLVVGAPQVDGPTTDRGAVTLFESRFNAPPNAHAGGPYLGFEGTALPLDASGSSDDRDPISELTFEWDLNYDGLAFHVDAIGMTPEVTFANNFPVRQIAVRVTDTEGASAIATTELQVDNVAPLLTVDQPVIVVQVGEPATNSGTYFDPGDDVVLLSSSLGTITDHGDGSWGWSLDVAEESVTVTITGTDEDGAERNITFELAVGHSAPSISVDESTVTVDEGSIASNTGTYVNPGNDPIVLTASLGSVIDQGDGMWSWSFEPLDGPDDSATVEIIVTDSIGVQSNITFVLVVENVAPSITVDSPKVTILGGETATMSGAYCDPGADVVTLTSSIGTIVDHGDGTWSWSWETTNGPDDSTIVVVTATDDDGAEQFLTFQVVDHDLAEIIQIIVGDGTSQRSIVSQMEVHFDTEVEIDPTAFLVEKFVADGTEGVTTEFTATTIDGRTVATITFSGAHSEITGSLVDGRYRLTIDGEQIRRAGTNSWLDADGDGVEGGIRVLGESLADGFFRLFGDVDGDFDVDVLDRIAFRHAAGSVAGDPNYDPRFDADGDGDVDENDRIRFLQNFRRFPVVDPMSFE